MELLNRYLQAVGQYLPAKTKDDTLAELRVNLMETMDDRAEALGRPLTEAEVSDVLRAHGKPEIVALRYLPQRSLIGPTIFPFYAMTVKRAFPLMALIYAVARVSVGVIAPQPVSTARAIVAGTLQFIPVSFMFLAVVTAVFAAIEYGSRKTGHTVPNRDWDPAKLPAIGQEKARSLSWRFADMAVHVALIAYVVSIPYHPYLVLGPGVGYLDTVPVGFSPEWHVFYLGIVGLLVLQLVFKVIGLSKMHSKSLFYLDLGVRVMGVGILGLMVAARVYFVPRAPANMSCVTELNMWVGLGFKIALVMVIADLIRNVWTHSRGIGKTGQLVMG